MCDEATVEELRAMLGSWRERLWTCHPDTRLGPAEVCEAFGKGRGWLYRLTRERAIPFRKLDGELTFRAADIRQWVQTREQRVVNPDLSIARAR